MMEPSQHPKSISQREFEDFYTGTRYLIFDRLSPEPVVSLREAAATIPMAAHDSNFILGLILVWKHVTMI